MKRLLLIAALLALSVAPAWAQSDARKVALFYVGSENNHNRTTGSLETTGNVVSMCNHMIEIALQRMGVPYTIFNAADSTGGWKSTMRASRPAGTADSTWFRQNGYFAVIATLSDVNSTVGTDMIRYFTDAGSNRGAQTGSPLDGNWGIPVLVFNMYGSNESGLTYFNGANGTDFTTRIGRAFYGSTDSLSIVSSQAQTYSTGEAANVTRLIMVGDSLNTGSFMAAWRYKSSLYFYDMPTYQRSAMLLMGLARVFAHAGYVPRRKLNLHTTWDHVIPETITSTASSESLYAYVVLNGMRISGAMKAYSGERSSNAAALTAYWKARRATFAAFPHSHIITDLQPSNGWVVQTGSDSAKYSGYWNFLERAITDTLGFTAAQGYERNLGLPSDRLHFGYMRTYAENRYTDVRATFSDSSGGGPSQNITSLRGVFAAAPSTSTTNVHRWALPYRYTEPTTGRGIYVHAMDSHPGGSSRLWADVAFDVTDNISGKTAANMNRVAFAILWDGDYYWHPNENLEGADQFMSTFMRRFTYFYSRVSNIVTIEPSYRTKFPSRSTVAR